MEHEFFYSFDDKGNAVLTRCVAHGARVVVPAAFDGRPVVAVGEECFATSSRVQAPNVVPFNAGGVLPMRGMHPNARIERVELPEGVRRIGRAAFRGCAALGEVVLPSTLEAIDDLAFSCSGVRKLALPAACVQLAPRALRTGPETLHGEVTCYRSKLSRIDVADGNERYCMDGAMLCRRLASGALEVVACPGEVEEACLTQEVERVSAEAFAGTYRIGELRFHDGIVLQGGAGLAGDACVSRVEIGSAQADAHGARAVMALEMPSPALQRRIFQAGATEGPFNRAAFLDAYDAALLQEADRLLQAKLMLARVAQPVCLSEASRKSFMSLLSRELEDLFVHFGARGYWRGFDQMVDAGLLHAANIARAIAVASAKADTTTVAHLLQLKRDRLDERAWDYAI